MSRLLLAADVTVIDRNGGVYVEFRDDAGEVFAIAGMKICAAVDFNEQVRVACERALVGQTSSGAVH